uniref:Uncharacterized protein n=1 Tax=Knipowitschia caucasica TaxID=637954 RepID=A0AAV2LRE1_KNICA
MNVSALRELAAPLRTVPCQRQDFRPWRLCGEQCALISKAAGGRARNHGLLFSERRIDAAHSPQGAPADTGGSASIQQKKWNVWIHRRSVRPKKRATGEKKKHFH